MRRLWAGKEIFQKIHMPGLTLHLGSSCRVAVELRTFTLAIAGGPWRYCLEVLP